MKIAETSSKKRRGLFAPDGYEWDDAPADVAEAMDAAHAAGPMPADFLAPPSELVFRAATKSTTLRIDADVLEWFKSMGKGYQTRINAVLRAYKAAHGG